MDELHSYNTFVDELAATRRQLRRLEKLAVALKRALRAQPRKLSPLFRLRAIQQRLAECEALLVPEEAPQPQSPSGPPLDHPKSAVVIPFPPGRRRHGTPSSASVEF